MAASLLLARRARAEEESPLVKELLARTKANERRRKIELENKYCIRQAEEGWGACADLDPEILREGIRESERLLEAQASEGEPRSGSD